MKPILNHAQLHPMFPIHNLVGGALGSGTDKESFTCKHELNKCANIFAPDLG